jgi:aminoglycoside phosphotransferase (APT) family kinase protein
VTTHFAKLAFSEATALRIWREAQALPLLSGGLGLPVPTVLACRRNPAMVATRFVGGGRPLTYRTVAAAPPSRVALIADQLARFLAQLHAPEALALARAHIDRVATVPEPGMSVSTDGLRARLIPMLEGTQRAAVTRWCAWVDRELATPADHVLVHGDFHPYNQLWDLDESRLLAVMDLESCGTGEPEFDLRVLPVFGPGTTLLTAVTDRYEAISGRRLSLPRIMAHHLLNYLGDALWRTEAGISLPEPGGTPAEYVAEAAGRLAALGIDPQ